jgi:hypothetical protein
MHCLSDCRTIQRAVLSSPLKVTLLGNPLSSALRGTYEHIGYGLKRVAEWSLALSNLLSIQRDLFREAPVAHRIYTHFDDFGYHLPFLHPTGKFGLEYEQCAKTLGDTRNVVGTQDALLHNLAQAFFAGLNFVGGELKLSYKDRLMTPRGDKGEGFCTLSELTI